MTSECVWKLFWLWLYFSYKTSHKTGRQCLPDWRKDGRVKKKAGRGPVGQALSDHNQQSEK